MNKKLLLSKPIRTENKDVEWFYEKGKIVITYPKKFGRIENWIKTRIGGKEEIRRPLDKFTTFIWELCDGGKNLMEIISEFDEKFGEEVAPADIRVQKFLENLLQLNLITLIT